MTIEITKASDDGIEIGAILIPRRFSAAIDLPDLPYVVHMDVEIADGKPRCVGLTCTARADGNPVTGSGLRRLPIAKLTQAAAARGAAIRRRIDPEREVQIKTWRMATTVRQREFVERELGSSSESRVLTDELLAEVASIYREAMATGTSPTKAVRIEKKLTQPTASRWVMKARERGFLGPTEPRKAGEIRQGDD